MELMQTLDAAWNSQDLATFSKRHRDDVVVRWPGQPFDVEFCTVARWDENGRIVEENLFYDLVTFMKQIGLGGCGR